MKSFITNALSLLFILVGYFSPFAREELMSIGWFAFSGAITNWLAIYMLFEKIPFLYGSGVIPERFEEFKNGIKSMMMNQFFTLQNVQRFIEQQVSAQVDKLEHHLDLTPLVEAINLDELFEKLTQVIMQSSFGGMLGMFGGVKALDGLKAPFKENVKIFLINLKDSSVLKEKLHAMVMQNSSSGDANQKTNEFVQKIQQMIDLRLNELTPQKVKDIIQEMIREHLGWLVVWGGVFGGLIGLVSALMTK